MSMTFATASAVAPHLSVTPNVEIAIGHSSPHKDKSATNGLNSPKVALKALGIPIKPGTQKR